MLAPGLESVPVGALVSRCHVQLAGVGSVLPAASVERTAKVCELSVRPEALCGVVHGAKAPPSMLHSNVEPGSEDVNVKVGVAALDGSAGFETIVVSGAVRSTLTFRLELDGWPAWPGATGAVAASPSA